MGLSLVSFVVSRVLRERIERERLQHLEAGYRKYLDKASTPQDPRDRQSSEAWYYQWKASWPQNSNSRTREKAKDISKSRIPNFPGLVPFCIDTSDSERRRIFSAFFQNLQDCYTSAPLHHNLLYFASFL